MISIIKKDQYSHRSMRTPLRKGIESTFDFEATRIPQIETNKGLACRVSRNKHMIELSSEVFVVGLTRARSYNTIMYKAVHMTYEASPSRHSQGLFKTQRDHCKTNRGQADHQTSNPIFISYICGKDILGATLIPTYKLPKLSGYAIRCWGYRGSIISQPN